VATADAPVASAPATCSAGNVDTIDDGQTEVTERGSMALEHVRLLARGDDDVITWTRRASYNVGDSWQTPYALSLRPGAGHPTPTEFPVESYACATYGIIATNTDAEPIAVWGRENYTGYELWKNIPSGKAKSERYVDTLHEGVHDFVASRNVAVAVGTGYACDVSCSCGDTWEDAVWIHGLESGHRFSVKLADDEADAPAIAMNEHGGIAVYRTKKKELDLVWLDATGKPEGKPTKFAEGGAPAVALAGDDAVVMWAARSAKSDPYALQWAKVAHGTTAVRPATIASTDSAFAPAIIADTSAMTIAWTEGDAGGRSGSIHVARTTFAHPRFDGTIVSGDETNARDPELSGTTEEPHLIWQSFPKEKPAGVLRVTHLRCSK
jgi:hypothetical protein